MGCLSAYFSGYPRKEKSKEGSHTIIYTLKNSHPVSCLTISFRSGIHSVITMLGHSRGHIDPHRKQCKPRKELHNSKLYHCLRHFPEILENLEKTCIVLH